jgi:uncharacterized membrane protein
VSTFAAFGGLYLLIQYASLVGKHKSAIGLAVYAVVDVVVLLVIYGLCRLTGAA